MFIRLHISDPVLVALITSMPATMAAIVGVINHRKLTEVHLDLDGRLSQLLVASVDKGRIAEREDIATGVQDVPKQHKGGS